MWYQEEDEQGKHISDNVSSLKLTDNNHVMFLTEYSDEKGILYFSKQGSEESYIASDVRDVITIGGAVYYDAYEHEKWNLYGASNDLDFKLLIENIMYIFASRSNLSYLGYY